jgi:hypothetical protein
MAGGERGGSSTLWKLITRLDLLVTFLARSFIFISIEVFLECGLNVRENYIQGVYNQVPDSSNALQRRPTLKPGTYLNGAL